MMVHWQILLTNRFINAFLPSFQMIREPSQSAAAIKSIFMAADAVGLAVEEEDDNEGKLCSKEK